MDAFPVAAREIDEAPRRGINELFKAIRISNRGKIADILFQVLKRYLRSSRSNRVIRSVVLYSRFMARNILKIMRSTNER